jgi:DNA-binding HxlR family transcriptional regulator
MWIVGKLMDPHARQVAMKAMCLEWDFGEKTVMNLPPGSFMVRVANTRRLEKESPPEYYFDPERAPAYRPAVISLPEYEDKLLKPVPPADIRFSMCDNPRYLRFFETYLRGRLEQLSKFLPDPICDALEKAIERELYGDIRSGSDDLVEFCGIGEELARMYVDKWRHEVKTQREKQMKRPLYTLGRNVEILASRPCVRVLAELEKYEKLNVNRLGATLQLSKSWLSRIISRLRERRFVERIGKEQHGSTVYAITKRGEGLLAWGQIVSWLAANPDTNLVIMRLEDKSWLLDVLTGELGRRDDATIAGWQGRVGVYTPLLNSQILLQSHSVRNGNIEEHLGVEANASLFERISQWLRNGLLQELLRVKGFISLSQVNASVNASKRTVRRCLGEMTALGLIEQKSHVRKKQIALTAEWRSVLFNCGLLKQDMTFLPQIYLSIVLESVFHTFLINVFRQKQIEIEKLEANIGRSLWLNG